MAGHEQSLVIGQDIAKISSDLYDSLFVQSLLQHGSRSDTTGAHGSSTRVDTRSRWHHFLDDLCFMCDSEHAGQSVTSIGVEEGAGGATSWITTAERYQESAACHLKEVLRILAKCSSEGTSRNSIMAEIALCSVERSQDRISAYVNRLERLERLKPEDSLLSGYDAQSSGKSSSHRTFDCLAFSDFKKKA